jgi:hypothetical protein
MATPRRILLFSSLAAAALAAALGCGANRSACYYPDDSRISGTKPGDWPDESAGDGGARSAPAPDAGGEGAGE